MTHHSYLFAAAILAWLGFAISFASEVATHRPCSVTAACVAR